MLGFGAGALIASVSFELAAEGLRVGGAVAVTIGLAVGALAFYLSDSAVSRWEGRTGGGAAGTPLGALLDGVAEQALLGIGLAQG